MPHRRHLKVIALPGNELRQSASSSSANLQHNNPCDCHLTLKGHPLPANSFLVPSSRVWSEFFIFVVFFFSYYHHRNLPFLPRPSCNVHDALETAMLSVQLSLLGFLQHDQAVLADHLLLVSVSPSQDNLLL